MVELAKVAWSTPQRAYTGGGGGGGGGLAPSVFNVDRGSCVVRVKSKLDLFHITVCARLECGTYSAPTCA